MIDHFGLQTVVEQKGTARDTYTIVRRAAKAIRTARMIFYGTSSEGWSVPTSATVLEACPCHTAGVCVVVRIPNVVRHA